MILKLKVMYQLYIKELTDKIEKADKEIGKLQIERDKIAKLLSKYEIPINQSYERPYKELIKITTLQEFRSVVTSNKNKIIPIYFEKLIRVNRSIAVLTYQRYKAEKQIVPYKVYKDICYKFNQKIIDAIVYNAYYFKPNNHFGAISIVKTEDIIPKIDWGKSNKKKAELESKGLTPYKKADAEAAAARGEKYEGIEWLVNLPTVNYYYYWTKNRTQKDFIPLVNDFKFTPSRRRNPNLPSPVRKLQEVKEDRTRAARLYTRTL